ncbi:HET-domain-containing protein, partial [Bimuria novae-zelandiae CBS 107.79]
MPSHSPPPPRSPPSSEPPNFIKQTAAWLLACNTLHGPSCVPLPIPSTSPSSIPRWLIDTHTHCIVPGVSAHRYLALSYVWPESRASSSDSSAPPPRTLLLSSTSTSTFQVPGFLVKEEVLESIPAVIRHAMAFTRGLGERYLWVDRLCIVQDEGGDGGTVSQVGMMDRIYNGAWLTVIAAGGDAMYEEAVTIYGTRKVRRQKMSEEDVVSVMRARYVMLGRSRWATRGWTYQEQILCKRAVVFIESGFFWDCHCCVWDGADLHPGQGFEGIALRADMGQRLDTRSWPDFSLYLDLVCPYNGREFSYPQDAMLGISGVLNALGRSFPGGFVHGLPRLFLDHALLWQPFGTAERRVDRNEEGVVRSSLPSWSWCGWQCYVDPWSLCSGLSYINEETCRRRGGSWRTRNLVEW